MAPAFNPRIIHTMLHVADMARSLAFYRDVLGMEIKVERKNAETGHHNVFLGYPAERASAELELTSYRDKGAFEHGEGYGHIGMAVDDCAAACAYLAEHGALISRPPKTMPSGSVLAFVRDPDGYEIELIQPAR